MKLVSTCDISFKVWLTEGEASTYLGISRDYLRGQRNEAKLTFRKLNNRIIYKREDLDKHIEKYAECYRDFETHLKRR